MGVSKGELDEHSAEGRTGQDRTDLCLACLHERPHERRVMVAQMKHFQLMNTVNLDKKNRLSLCALVLSDLPGSDGQVDVQPLAVNRQVLVRARDRREDPNQLPLDIQPSSRIEILQRLLLLFPLLFGPLSIQSECPSGICLLEKHIRLVRFELSSVGDGFLHQLITAHPRRIEGAPSEGGLLQPGRLFASSPAWLLRLLPHAPNRLRAEAAFGAAEVRQWRVGTACFNKCVGKACQICSWGGLALDVRLRRVHCGKTLTTVELNQASDANAPLSFPSKLCQACWRLRGSWQLHDGRGILGCGRPVLQTPGFQAGRGSRSIDGA
mmetsp:Transcript_19793/g.46741  ORF Transcript_19793/g.46741 Transcript_19793/m.46741 type:complete len:324 (-) Transcript_19793:101-1072(-)